MPLGKYSRDKAVDCLNGTALPGAMRIPKVNGDFGGEGEGGMQGHFTTVVVGGGLAQVPRQALECASQGSGDAFGVLFGAKRDNIT